MTKRQDHATDVAGLSYGQLTAYLDQHSGLPGPRGNIELAEAVADVADSTTLRQLCAETDEFRKTCGATGTGALLIRDEPGALELAHRLASDDSWRVREGVAMALQRLGDQDPARMRSIVAQWVRDPDPLVRRAAIAGICEPRLLNDPLTASAALDACDVATASIAAAPSTERRDPSLRTLRQALGYCWSVAVAGAPGEGLSRFGALQAAAFGDSDLAWIVRTNLTKKRLARLL